MKNLITNNNILNIKKDELKMKDDHKELVIKTAIQEYKNSVLFGFSNNTLHAINMMENAYIMCAPFNIKGIAELSNTIKEAKKIYKTININNVLEGIIKSLLPNNKQIINGGFLLCQTITK